MSGPNQGKPKGRQRPLISDDDKALWEFVARRFEPAKGKSRVRDVEPAEASTARIPAVPPADPPPRPAMQPAPKTSPQARAVMPQAPPVKPTPVKPPHPQPVTLERRKARRIAKGTEEIEARLDLHGMTQDDAHYALVGFVRRCFDNGFRTVLVITGKGGSRRNDDEGDDVVPRHRGVLRRNVPRWLAGPELASLVVSYATAHIRHGGEGALYVRLRRNG